MPSLGFRPPQFSEDVAWLPAWLQHTQAEPSIDHAIEPQSTSSDEAFKHSMFFRGEVNGGKDVDILSSEEGRYNSCHLFLSGEDNSHSITPSPMNVFHLRLHLSSEGDSQRIQSELLYTPEAQVLHCSNKVLSSQVVETSAGQRDKMDQSKVCDNDGKVKCLSPSSIPVDAENVGAEFSANNENSLRQREKKMEYDAGGLNFSSATSTQRSLENAITGDREESSPLTSIPVTVDDVGAEYPTANKDSLREHAEKMEYDAGGTQFSPPTSVPKSVENVAPLSPTNYKYGGQQHEEKFNVNCAEDAEINDSVELSIAASVALVTHELMKTDSALEVWSTGAILEAALWVKQARLETLEDAFQCSSDELNEIDSLSDLDDSVMTDAFLDIGLPFNVLDDQHGCASDVSQVAETHLSDHHHGHNNNSDTKLLLAHHDKTHDDSALCLNASDVACPVDQISCLLPKDISQDLATPQPQVDVNSSHACASGNVDEDVKVHYLVPDRFQSRWLGGWTFKESDASARLKLNKSIPSFFVRETSFLSESADVAADENSFAQKHDTGFKIVSQSSIPFDGLRDKVDNEICFSQGDKSSEVSLVDSLCSVVPCSISSEKSSISLTGNQERDVDENCFIPNSEIGIENSRKPLDLKGEHVDKQTQTSSGECFEAPVRRRFVSLRTYSTLSPRDKAILEGGRPPAGELVSSYQDMGSIGSLDKKMRSAFEFIVDKDDEKRQDAASIRYLDAEMEVRERNHDECTKEDAQLHGQLLVQKSSPVVLNRRRRCHPHASKLLSPGMENAELGVGEKITGNHGSKSLQKIQSNLRIPNNTQNPVRKRVHFSEVEVGLQKNEYVQKLQTSNRECSAVSVSKRSKCLKGHSDDQYQDVTIGFIGHIKDIRRLIFHGLEFLLTGYSSQKEREIMGLIQKHGGTILLDIPAPPANSRTKRILRCNSLQVPIVISSKKLQTAKFLYACAVNALILKLKWLTDSIAAGSVVPPGKYMILSNRPGPNGIRIVKSVIHDGKCIFDGVGIMPHGKPSFCTKLAVIVKHGGGQVFKTLLGLSQSLDSEKVSIGVIVAEDESRALRHLKHCASERKIPMMPASWIAKSLHFGKLLPVREKENAPSKERESSTLTMKVPEAATSSDWSQEI